MFWSTFDTLRIDEIGAAALAAGSLPSGAQIAIALVACAALLKSAQLPFHGWLIQVMEAPTPVSALLHAGVVNLGQRGQASTVQGNAPHSGRWVSTTSGRHRLIQRNDFTQGRKGERVESVFQMRLIRSVNEDEVRGHRPPKQRYPGGRARM